MNFKTLSRRGVVGGMAVLGAGGQALAEGPPPTKMMPMPPTAKAFDIPSLKSNILARMFQDPSARMTLPKVKVENEAGVSALTPRAGLTMISLWAPWCAPCLLELRELAALQVKFGGPRFRILPIVTGMRTPLTVAEAKATLIKHGAGVFDALVERDTDTTSLFKTVAVRQSERGTGSAIPCNIVIDAKGVVLGRQFGAPVVKDAEGVQTTKWATPLGEQLIGALARGEVSDRGVTSSPPRPFVS